MGRTRYYESLETPLKREYTSEPDVIWIPPEKRMHFKLFERGFTQDEAIEEAKRCLHCGPCASCKACISIGLQDSLPTIEVDENMCSGCGICISACGYGAAYMKNVGGVIRSAEDVAHLAAMDVDAVLVGEALVTAKDVAGKVQELVGG